MNLSDFFKELENTKLSNTKKLNQLSELAKSNNYIFIYGDALDIIHVKGKFSEQHILDTGYDFSEYEKESILKTLKVKAFYYGEIDYEEINKTKIPWTFTTDSNKEILRFNLLEDNHEVYSQGILIKL